MARILATGTFDVLHPGHVYYLEKSKDLGDELFVIIARTEMVSHKEDPILPDEQRRKMVDSLEVVDKAFLGSKKSKFDPLYQIEPDIITIGYDQHYDIKELKNKLQKRGFDIDVVRIDDKRPPNGHLYSTSEIIRSIKKPYLEPSQVGWRGIESRLVKGSSR